MAPYLGVRGGVREHEGGDAPTSRPLEKTADAFNSASSANSR
jgi:hypothetical protein